MLEADSALYPEKPDKSDQSPLDQIQDAEANLTRRIAAAHERARHLETKAQGQISHILNEAQQQGQSEGEIDARKIIAQAEQDAQNLLIAARQKADALSARGESCMSTAVQHAVAVVAGIDMERP